MGKKILVACVLLSISIFALIIFQSQSNLVEIRNFFIYKNFDDINNIAHKNHNGEFFKQAYSNETNINSFEELIEYREGRIRNKGFTDELIFRKRLRHCFSDDNLGYMCGCSDLSEMIIAFCNSINDQCFEIVNGSKHSLIYNKTRNIVVDLFYGFTFNGTINELIIHAKKNTIETSDKFRDLGQYIPKDIILVSGTDKYDEDYKDPTNYKLKKLELKQVKELNKLMFKPWGEVIINSLGRETSNLKIQNGQYYWTGQEKIIPFLTLLRKVNINLYLGAKEISGYFYNL
tara:strand:+ start:3376 stop:4242 length:867 start_codon:yes stop_codon:yes gene_type:complete